MTDLRRADFRETLAAIATAGGCDLILTSPPYHDARTVDAYGTAAWTMQDDRDLGDAVFAALKPGGHCLLVIDAPVREWRKGVGTERGLQPWRLLLDWADRVGLRAVDRLAYGRLGLRGAYSGRFRNDWEPMLWFQRPGAKGFFDKTPLNAPAKHPTRWAAGMSASSRTSDGTFYKRGASGEAIEQGVMRRGTFWDYGAVGKGCSGSPALETTGHPARFPLRLAADAVACFCPPDGLVVDPFLGSGTTMVAALQAGRRFTGGDAGQAPDGRAWVDIAAGVAEAEGLLPGDSWDPWLEREDRPG